MKKIFLSAVVFLSVTAYGGCPTISATMIRSTPVSNDYTLQITFIRNGEDFYIRDTIFCNGIVITSGCNTFDVTGTMNIKFSCSGTPLAKVIPFLGVCGDAPSPCPFVVVDPSGGATPVVLSAFAIQRSGINVITEWRTEQEINSDYFAIERSLDNNKTYQEVAKVNSHVNSSTAHTYSFIDRTNKYKGISFYRIKLVDKDGAITFTGAKTVKGLVRVSQNFVVYPNPSYGSAKITITDLSEPSLIQVFDNSGRMVNSEILVNKDVVEINKLQKGSYIIKMTGKESGTTIVRKFTVIN